MKITDSTLDNTNSVESENTLPAASSNYAAVRFNAVKHGVLSRHTVLPHEDADEYQALHMALVNEHRPNGPTEAHLVEELAGIIWRKRRVLQAEGGQINESLKSAAQCSDSVISAAIPFESGLSGRGIDLQELMSMTPEQVAESQEYAQNDLEATRKAVAILENGGTNAYDKAIAALQPESRDWWQQFVEEDEYPATAERLAKFIRENLEPLCVRIEKQFRHYEAIKAQALGQGIQPFRLEKLNRYETHLDRKFERTLGMLVKLREMRGGK